MPNISQEQTQRKDSVLFPRRQIKKHRDKDTNVVLITSAFVFCATAPLKHTELPPEEPDHQDFQPNTGHLGVRNIRG